MHTRGVRTLITCRQLSRARKIMYSVHPIVWYLENCVSVAHFQNPVVCFPLSRHSNKTLDNNGVGQQLFDAVRRIFKLNNSYVYLYTLLLNSNVYLANDIISNCQNVRRVLFFETNGFRWVITIYVVLI